MLGALDLPGELARPLGGCGPSSPWRGSTAATGGTASTLVRLAGGWAFRTDARCHAVVPGWFEMPRTPAAVPGLRSSRTVIAYVGRHPAYARDPVIGRGRNAGDPWRKSQLRLRRYTSCWSGGVSSRGRAAPAAGGAILYGTTPALQRCSASAGLDELPPLEASPSATSKRRTAPPSVCLTVPELTAVARCAHKSVCQKPLPRRASPPGGPAEELIKAGRVTRRWGGCRAGASATPTPGDRRRRPAHNKPRGRSIGCSISRPAC